jgi:hypothetical protein
VIVLHRGLGNLHPDVGAYNNTLVALSVRIDPRGTREEMVKADGSFEE